MTETTHETTSITLQISGMDCADCAVTLEQGVTRLDGVQQCQVNFTSGKMNITGQADLEHITRRITDLGYGIADETEQAAPPPRSGAGGFLRFMLSRQDTRLALIGIGLLLVSFVLYLVGLRGWPVAALHLSAVALSGWPILQSGWRELIYTRKITINQLMIIAAAGAVLIGETGEAATVVALFAIGEALEGYAADRARYSLRGLLDLVPQDTAVMRPCMDCVEHMGQDGYDGGPCPFCGVHETRIPVNELQIDDVVLVAPGERIPMDGAVTAGQSAVNQAPITGESIPVDKAPGDSVFAGTINGSGALEVQVSHLAEDNTLNRIIHLIEEAQASRAPSQRFIDGFARWYTPAVALLALLMATIPPLLFGAPFWDTPDARGWLYRALALLIIGCPCSLVISTPVTIVSALTRAARQGILIKGGGPLEALATIRAIAFDKTGTLTTGTPTLTAVQAVACIDEAPHATCDQCDEVLALAAAVERRSEHPLAQAVVQAAGERAMLERSSAAQNVTSLTGRGIQGEIDSHTITIGSHAYFDTQYPHPQQFCEAVTALEADGQTAMLLADGESVRGVLTVADQPRTSSQDALNTIRSMRPAPHTVMLTGDNPATARHIADHVGIDEVRAGLLPEDKLDAIHEVEAAHGPTAMVGDGINDSPALAAATIGIAMGGIGSTQAMETADIVLMQDDLRHLPDAVQISRRALATIRQNIGLSLGLKGAVLLLALFGWTTLWLAVFADVGASLIVTANGMRMLRD